jgi:ADP-heptose:LPS heptosyltransferase
MINQNIFYKIIKISDFIKKKDSETISFPLMSLPKLFNIETNNLMSSLPYLFPRKTKIDQWKKKIDKKKFNIGIAWQSIKTPAGIEKTIPYQYYLKLLDMPNVKLISLHVPSQLDIEINLLDSSRIIFFENLDIENKFEDTSALIASLDLIITIDTSIAHLSATMKKNTWILLPYNSDWRWGLKTEKSIWYDSVTLFRSTSYKNWDYVFNNVMKKLKTLLN